jgi:hypothetical protein
MADPRDRRPSGQDPLGHGPTGPHALQVEDVSEMRPPMETMYLVYAIGSLGTGRIYIGQTKDFERSLQNLRKKVIWDLGLKLGSSRNCSGTETSESHIIY